MCIYSMLRTTHSKTINQELYNFQGSNNKTKSRDHADLVHTAYSGISKANFETWVVGPQILVVAFHISVTFNDGSLRSLLLMMARSNKTQIYIFAYDTYACRFQNVYM